MLYNKVVTYLFPLKILFPLAIILLKDEFLKKMHKDFICFLTLLNHFYFIICDVAVDIINELILKK